MDPVSIIIIGVVGGVLTSALLKPLKSLGELSYTVAYYQLKIRKYKKRLDKSIKELDYIKFDKYIAKIRILDESYRKSNISKIKVLYNIKNINVLENERDFVMFFTPDNIKQYFIEQANSDIGELVEGSVMRAMENYTPPFLSEEELSD